MTEEVKRSYLEINSLNDLKYLKLNTFDDLNNFSNYLARQISL